MTDFPADTMQFPEYDPSDPDQVEQVERAAALRRLEEREYVRRLVATYEGRAFIWALLSETGVHRSSFAGEAPLTMAHAEGRREIGIWAENWVFTVAPETYSMMRREAVEREKRYRRQAGMRAD